MSSIITEARTVLARVIHEEDGQGLTEYAMILALIALLAIVALTFLGGSVSNEMSTAAQSL
jgi:pilus assembly protein Flp/PilA